LRRKRTSSIIPVIRRRHKTFSIELYFLTLIKRKDDDEKRRRLKNRQQQQKSDDDDDDDDDALFFTHLSGYARVAMMMMI
tara:strand:+ start:1260 stop:1499 length:240 start_codon:yes stop_codon:yes gene_type:complete